MSGHSKWATIKRAKAANDAKRSKVFTKLIREISVAAKLGGGDPDANPRLRFAIDAAKAQNMPADNIDRAIKKATGEAGGDNYEDVVYEARGPEGVFLMIECLTDNRNRTVAEVRNLLNKNGGSMADSGSIAWNFDRKGQIVVETGDRSEDDWMEIALEAGAEDIEVDGEYTIIYTEFQDMDAVRKALDAQKVPLEEVKAVRISKDKVTAENEEAAEKIERFLELVEDQDDVQNVFSNYEAGVPA